MGFGMMKFRFTTHTYTLNNDNGEKMWFDYSSHGGSEDIHKLVSGIDELKLKATENVRFQFEPVIQQGFGETLKLYLETGAVYKVTLTPGTRPGTITSILVEKIKDTDQNQNPT